MYGVFLLVDLGSEVISEMDCIYDIAVSVDGRHGSGTSPHVKGPWSNSFIFRCIKHAQARDADAKVTSPIPNIPMKRYDPQVNSPYIQGVPFGISVIFKGVP